MPLVKAYKEGEVHYEGDVVTHLGATWQAQCDTARLPGEGDEWTMLAQAGRNALSPTVRGTFDPKETYNALDIVALNGSSFLARKADPGDCPGPGWQLIASAGRPGKPGPKGDRGDRGEKGLSGDRGEAAPVILGWEVDKKNFRITPIMSDGSEQSSLDLRPLFEQYQIEAH